MSFSNNINRIVSTSIESNKPNSPVATHETPSTIRPHNSADLPDKTSGSFHLPHGNEPTENKVHNLPQVSFKKDDCLGQQVEQSRGKQADEPSQITSDNNPPGSVSASNEPTAANPPKILNRPTPKTQQKSLYQTVGEDNLRICFLALVMMLYMLGGATVFKFLEEESEIKMRSEFAVKKRAFISSFNLTEAELDIFLKDFMVMDHLGMLDVSHTRWSFSGALYFVGTVVSTIGFGSTTPVTLCGRLFLMLYGLVGCAGGILFFNTFLERIITLLALIMKNWTKLLLKRKGLLDNLPSGNRNPFSDDLESWKPSIYWVCFYLFLGAIILAFLASALYSPMEDWSYLDSLYFCTVAFTTIGFGDYVPAQSSAVSPININLYRLVHGAFMLMGCCFTYSLLNVISIIIKNSLTHILRHVHRMEVQRRTRRPTLHSTRTSGLLDCCNCCRHGDELSRNNKSSIQPIHLPRQYQRNIDVSENGTSKTVTNKSLSPQPSHKTKHPTKKKGTNTHELTSTSALLPHLKLPGSNFGSTRTPQYSFTNPYAYSMDIDPGIELGTQSFDTPGRSPSLNKSRVINQLYVVADNRVPSPLPTSSGERSSTGGSAGIEESRITCQQSVDQDATESFVFIDSPRNSCEWTSMKEFMSHNKVSLAIMQQKLEETQKLHLVPTGFVPVLQIQSTSINSPQSNTIVSQESEQQINAS